MKKTKKLNRKHFRYLTKKEFKNPLYVVADFCTNVISLREWKSRIDLLIKIACTSPKGLKIRDFSNLYYYWGHLSKHIELLYLLKYHISDWTIDKDSSLYKATFYYGSTLIYDPDLRHGTYMEFDRLKAKEIKNMGIYIDKFFDLMSLWEWQRMMDELLSTFFDDSQLGRLVAYSGKDTKIYRYLEKLGEAIYLIYVLKAKEHVAKHHPNDLKVAPYYDGDDVVCDEEEGMETEEVSDENQDTDNDDV